MNYAQDNSLTIYRLWAVALGVGIVVVTICGSLGLVWMRQQVSAMAMATSRLESSIADAERESASLDARLGRALSPQYLATRLPEGLRPSSAGQIVRSGRPQQLAPAPGFENAVLTASARPAVRAGSAVAATTAPTLPSARAAQTRNRLVSTTRSEPAPAQEEAPLTVTFDLARPGAQPLAGASARQ